MKPGIIITFYNRANDINICKIEDFITQNNNIHLCFVNNGSTDKTKEVLESLHNKFPNKISVVNIKNNKGEESALKVGFRYLLNNKNVNQISISNQLNLKELSALSSNV